MPSTTVRIAAVALAMFATIPAGAGAESADDWVLVHALAGGGGFDGRVAISVDVETDASGPLVIGVGDAWGDGSSYVGVGSYDEGHRVVDVGTPVVQRRVEVLPGGVHADRAWYSLGFQAFREEPVSFLLFVGNGVFTSTPVVAIEPTAGSMSIVETVTGGGSVSVGVGEASDRIAIVAGSAGAGVVGHDASVATGIAGSSAWRCERCSGAWHAPDGRTGEWTGSGSPLPFGGWDGSGWIAFAGPSGDWRFEFEGVVSAQGALGSHRPEPLLVAYAPIGDAYRLFDWHRFAG